MEQEWAAYGFGYPLVNPGYVAILITSRKLFISNYLVCLCCGDLVQICYSASGLIADI